MTFRKLVLLFISLAIFSIITEAHSKAFIGKAVTPEEQNGYWTPERMKNAKWFPTPAVDPNKVQERKLVLRGKKTGAEGAPPNDSVQPDLNNILYTPSKISSIEGNQFHDTGSLNQEYSSSRLVPLTADLTYPYRAVGKLFFTEPGVGDFVCSASVIRQRIVLTAGHCIHKGSGGAAGFYTNFLFVPAFRDGAAPFQAWNYRYVAINNTWATGGGSVPNAADYGMLEMEDRTVDNSLKKISYLTGYFGYQTLSLIPNHAHLLGYPCNLDACQKMHQVTAQSARSIGFNTAEYGSDMRGGSSGGPWIQNFGAYADGQIGGLNSGINRIIGVTSYVYTDIALKAEGASIFDSRFTSLLNFICANRTGNCSD